MEVQPAMVGETFGGEVFALRDQFVGALGAAEADERAIAVGGDDSGARRGFDEPVVVVGEPGFMSGLWIRVCFGA